MSLLTTASASSASTAKARTALTGRSSPPVGTTFSQQWRQRINRMPPPRPARFQCHSQVFPRLKLGLGLDLSMRLGSPPPRIACLHQHTQSRISPYRHPQQHASTCSLVWTHQRGACSMLSHVLHAQCAAPNQPSYQDVHPEGTHMRDILVDTARSLASRRCRSRFTRA